MDTPADFDSPWKEILEGYFPQFLEFFFPYAAADIDWVMTLPEELADEFWNTMQNFEEVRQVPYITSIERIGIRKGLEQGLQQGLHESIMELLNLRFAPIAPSVRDRIEAVTDIEVLRELVRSAAMVKSLDEFLAGLDAGDA